MNKVLFFKILKIMKGLRMKYEQDCVFHWNYKLHYSTKWMGVDKSAITVLELKKCPMLEMGSRSHEAELQAELEAERLMSLLVHPELAARGERAAGADQDDHRSLDCG